MHIHTCTHAHTDKNTYILKILTKSKSNNKKKKTQFEKSNFCFLFFSPLLPPTDCRFVCKSYRSFEEHLLHSASHRNKEDSSCFLCTRNLPKANVLKHLQTHHIGLFQCIYCRFGCISLELIRLHLAKMHLNELPYTVLRRQPIHVSNVDPADTNATSMVRVSKESSPELLVVPPITTRQMNFMRPEITAEATEFNAGICPSDDGPSIEIEIREAMERTQNEHQALNQEIEHRYNIALAEDVLKMVAPALPPPKVSPNLVIKSVRSLSRAPISVASSPVKVKQLTPQPAPSTSRALPAISTPSVTKVGESPLTISHVACGVDFKDAPRPTVQSEIDLAARSLVKGTGFEGTDLYRCGLTGCTASFENDQEFLRHLVRHAAFPCFHCGVRYDKSIALKNHIKCHGTHRYFCYCCNTTAPVLNTMVEHFKETHYRAVDKNATAQANETIVLPLNEQCGEAEKDMFVVCPRGTRSIKAFGLNLVQHNKSRILSTKKFYAPDEVLMLPHQAIFPESVACSLCGYSSKIRSNIHRHLIKADCGPDANVPGTDPVNPVPCLNTGERHFDKMRNLAASSNPGGMTNSGLPHVPEERRYVCGARACHYQTQTEEMLRSHIETLHAGDEYFHCPHCNRDLASGKAIVAADAINHLRFHGPRLFKCPACVFYHYLKPTIDKHVLEAHPRCKDVAIQLRPKALDISKSNKQAVFKWKCNVCSKAIFDTRQNVRAHLAKTHRLDYQYQCMSPNCSFQNDLKNNVKEHLLSAHGSAENGLVKTVYERVEGEIDVTPIWRRDDPNRVSTFGIYLSSIPCV